MKIKKEVKKYYTIFNLIIYFQKEYLKGNLSLKNYRKKNKEYIFLEDKRGFNSLKITEHGTLIFRTKKKIISSHISKDKDLLSIINSCESGIGPLECNIIKCKDVEFLLKILSNQFFIDFYGDVNQFVVDTHYLNSTSIGNVNNHLYLRHGFKDIFLIPNCSKIIDLVPQYFRISEEVNVIDFSFTGSNAVYQLPNVYGNNFEIKKTFGDKYQLDSFFNSFKRFFFGVPIYDNLISSTKETILKNVCFKTTRLDNEHKKSSERLVKFALVFSEVVFDNLKKTTSPIACAINESKPEEELFYLLKEPLLKIQSNDFLGAFKSLFNSIYIKDEFFFENLIMFSELINLFIISRYFDISSESYTMNFSVNSDFIYDNKIKNYTNNLTSNFYNVAFKFEHNKKLKINAYGALYISKIDTLIIYFSSHDKYSFSVIINNCIFPETPSTYIIPNASLFYYSDSINDLNGQVDFLEDFDILIDNIKKLVAYIKSDSENEYLDSDCDYNITLKDNNFEIYSIPKNFKPSNPFFVF